MLESEYHDPNTDERYIQVDVENGACRLILDESEDVGPALANEQLRMASRGGKIIDKLIFVPYYSRANRGGKGHMRVGLRWWYR